jgi:D-alanyl-D-alanine dipeptidase
MGGGFDFMDERSHHASTDIGPVEMKNRKFLRSIMESSGFEAYAFEWWHYMLRDEPYPDRYFDFLVA